MYQKQNRKTNKFRSMYEHCINLLYACVSPDHCSGPHVAGPCHRSHICAPMENRNAGVCKISIPATKFQRAWMNEGRRVNPRSELWQPRPVESASADPGDGALCTWGTSAENEQAKFLARATSAAGVGRAA